MSGPTRQDWPTDDVLVAYADGMLDVDEAAAVAKHLEADAEARAFVRALRESADLAKHAFDDALKAPVSMKHVETIMKGPDAQSAEHSQAGKVVPLTQRPKFSRGAYAVPLAASIALLIGGFGGFQLSERTRQPSPSPDFVAVGPVPDNSTVLSALETVASNDPVALGNPGASTSELMIVATFRDAAGRICRELEVTATGAPPSAITAAVACRQTDGKWLVEGAVRMATSPTAPDHDFAPAKGDKTSAIEGVLTAIGAKGALSQAEEKQLLERRWE